MRVFSFLILFVFFLSTVFAQSGEGKILRGEILVKDVESVNFIPIGYEGLLTLAKLEKSSKLGNWELSCYDTNFKLKWKTLYLAPSGFELIKYQFANDSNLHLFFGEKDQNFLYFNYLSLNYYDGSIASFNVPAYGRYSFNSLDVLDTKIFTCGNTNPGFFSQLGQFFYSLTLVPFFNGSKVYSIKATVNAIDVNSKANTSFQPDLKGDSHIICTTVDSANHSFVCILENEFKRKINYYLICFDEQGNTTSMNLLSNIDKTLVSAQLIGTKNGELFFAGTYCTNFSNASAQADGLFFCKIDKGVCSEIKYHPFGSLQSAAYFLSLRDRKRAANNPDKNPIDIGLKLLLHSKISMVDSSYVLVGETYYPEYHQTTSYDARGYMYSTTVFDGYRYTNAIAVGFDYQGNRLWDNIIEMGDAVSFQLQEKAIFYTDETDQALMYYYNGMINAKIFQKNKGNEPKDIQELPMVNKNEKLVSEDNSNIYHWYDSYFLITSFQKVIAADGRKRKVYSFNKITFQ